MSKFFAFYQYTRLVYLACLLLSIWISSIRTAKMATVMRDTLSIDVERSNINSVNMSEEATTPTSPQSVGMPVIKQPEMLYLPNTLADWPWPRFLNPHYDEVGHQSRQWLRSFNAFPAKAQNAFDACDFSMFTS